MSRYFIVFTLAALAVMLPEMAAADTLDTTIGQKACLLANVLTGNLGKAIATIGVIMLGIGAFFGKLNWSLVLIVALGVAIIFGSAKIITAVADGDAVGNCA